MAATHVDPREDDVDEIEGGRHEDDWFFDSIKSYNHLHMYELQNIPTAIDFVNKEALCICCKKEEGGSEILELHIPDTLLAGKETLSKDRDFSFISGGFHSQAIVGITCLPGTRNFITTEEKCNSVNLWRLGTDTSEMCKLKGQIKNSIECSRTAQSCVFGSHSGVVAFGSALMDICIADINLEKVIHTTKLPQDILLGHISFLDENTLFISSTEGQAWLMDTRENGKLSMTFPKVMTSEVKATWSCDTQSQRTFVRVNDQGFGDFGDIRNCQNSHKFKLAIPTMCNNKNIKMRVSPHSNIISLSGLNGNIQLYNITKSRDSEETLDPFFTHQGHSACSDLPRTVTISTAWYPWQQDLIFSAADDESLHAWDFNFDHKE